MLDTLANNISHEPLLLCRDTPIVVNVDAASTTIIDRSKLRYYLELYVPEYYLSNNFVKIETFEAFEEPVEQVGSMQIFAGAYFEFQSHLDALLSIQVPAYNEKKISVCSEIAIPFYTKAIIKNDGVVISTVTNPIAYAYKAGIAMRDYKDYQNNFFTDYIGKNNKFLTWQNSKKRVLSSSHEYLNFLVNFSPLPNILQLRVMVKFEDNSELIFTAQALAGITAYSTYCFAVSPNVLGLGDLEKVISSYQVWVSNENNQRLSEVRTYILDYKYYKSVKHILFAGSLGNWDSISCIGKATENMKISKQVSERYSGFDYLPNFSERIISELKGERELIVNTGFIPKKQAEYLTELVLSRDVFIASDREYLPLVLQSDNFVLHDSDENLLGRQFVFTYCNPESNYSNLPLPIVSELPATGWRALVYGSCLLDANGRRTGRAGVSLLEKYYIATNEAVRPRIIKKNLPNEEGYIDSIESSACAVTPFLNVAISRKGTYVRNNCENGYGGTKATITIPANTYGSEVSLADANAKAEAAWNRLNTQEYANTNGSCIASPEYYSVTVAVNRWNYRLYTNTSGTLHSINGGIGAYSGGITDAYFGNIWARASQVDNINIYPQSANDISLPCNTGHSQPYFVNVSGWDKNVNVTIYVDGVQVSTTTISKSQFQNSNSIVRVLLPMVIPSQAMIYVKIIE